MHSIHDMMQRFRETRPTSRRERLKQRQLGQLKEMWWIRDDDFVRDTEADEASVSHDSLDEDHNESNGNSLRCKGAVRGVDEMIAEDIEDILHDASRTSKARRVGTSLVSPSPCPKSPTTARKHMSRTFRPRGTLIPAVHRRTPAGSPKTGALTLPDSLEHALALPTPRSYTGSAELRSDLPSAAYRKEFDRDRDKPDMDPGASVTMNVPVSSAAAIASELDTMLQRLRRGCDGQGTTYTPEFPERGQSPVNLAQIAHDLDAQLLKFNLMAEARLKAAGEAEIAEDAAKMKWREEETKRIEEMVRKEEEEAALDEAAIARAAVLQGDFVREHGVDAFSSVPLRGLLPGAWDLGASGGLDILRRTPNGQHELQSRHSEGVTSALLEDPLSPVEAAKHQMAEVLRAVEARVKSIEALEAIEPILHGANSAEPTATPSEAAQEEDRVSTDAGQDLEEAEIAISRQSKEHEGDEAQHPDTVSATLPVEAGALIAVKEAEAAPGHDVKETRLATCLLQGARAVRRERCRDAPFMDHILPPAVPLAWIYGQTTLARTGQCIGAELDVTMLCMQKRLGKNPIVHHNADGTSPEDLDNGQGDAPNDPPEKRTTDADDDDSLEDALVHRLRARTSSVAARDARVEARELVDELAFDDGQRFGDHHNNTNDGQDEPPWNLEHVVAGGGPPPLTAPHTHLPDPAPGSCTVRYWSTMNGARGTDPTDLGSPSRMPRAEDPWHRVPRLPPQSDTHTSSCPEPGRSADMSYRPAPSAPEGNPGMWRAGSDFPPLTSARYTTFHGHDGDPLKLAGNRNASLEQQSGQLDQARYRPRGGDRLAAPPVCDTSASKKVTSIAVTRARRRLEGIRRARRQLAMGAEAESGKSQQTSMLPYAEAQHFLARLRRMRLCYS